MAQLRSGRPQPRVSSPDPPLGRAQNGGRWDADARRWAPSVALLLIGGLLELALVVRLLRPFSLVKLSGPQLATEPFAAVLGSDGAALGSWLMTLAALFGLYFAALALVRLVPARALRVSAAGFAALFALTLWPTIALGSTDLYHYILDGRALAIHGDNPLAIAPAAAPHDRLDGILFYNRENTGAYGPLFYLLAGGAALLGRDNLVWSTLAMKGLAVLWLLGCLPLLHALAERLRPGSGGSALVAFGWNPLVFFEAAGSGHNDIGVAFFALLAYWLALSGRWRWALPAIALGALVKPTALLALPSLLVWLAFSAGHPSRRELLLWLVMALVMAALLYTPFWAGTATFGQLRHISTLRISSPADAAVALASARMSRADAIWRVKLVSGALFLAGAAAVLLRTRGNDPARLVWSAAWCLVAYLMLAAWWFWPWYLMPLIALSAALWPDRVARLAAVFSASAMLLYAGLGWRLLLFSYQTEFSQAVGLAVIGFLPPALVWASGWWQTEPPGPAPSEEGP